MPSDTKFTSIGHSRNHPPTPSAFLTGCALISRVDSGPAGGSGPLDLELPANYQSWNPA